MNIIYRNIKIPPTNSPLAVTVPSKSSMLYNYNKPIELLFIEICTDAMPSLPFRVNVFSVKNPQTNEAVRITLINEVWVKMDMCAKIICEEFSLSIDDPGVPVAIKVEVVAPVGSTAFNWYANIAYRELV